MSASLPPATSRLIVALRGEGWVNPRLVRLVSVVMLLGGGLAYANWVAQTVHGIDPATLKPIAADFTSFWIAAGSVVAGAPATAYDLQAHTAAQLAAFAYPPGAAVPIVTWSYPPVFLLLVAPFGLLPITWAFAVWMVLTTGLFVLAVRRIAPAAGGWLPVLAALGFTATQINLQYGQNGALTAGLFGFALWWLPRRPWLAGACLALLTCKPQLGVMLPLALLAGRQWRGLAAAVALTLALAALSVALFGLETWAAFFATLGWSRHALLDQGDAVWHRSPSVFAALRLAGAPVAASYAGQAAVALLAAGLMWRIWSGRTRYDRKAAALAFATVAGTPFLLTYDLMLLGIGIAFLARDGVAHGFRPWLPLLLALSWYSASISDFAAPWAVPFAPALGVAMLALLVRG